MLTAKDEQRLREIIREEINRRFPTKQCFGENDLLVGPSPPLGDADSYVAEKTDSNPATSHEVDSQDLSDP